MEIDNILNIARSRTCKRRRFRRALHDRRVGFYVFRTINKDETFAPFML